MKPDEFTGTHPDFKPEVVAAGWLVIPDTTINVVVSAVGLLGSVVSTILARRKVAPLAKHGDGGAV